MAPARGDTGPVQSAVCCIANIASVIDQSRVRIFMGSLILLSSEKLRAARIPTSSGRLALDMALV